MLGLLGEVWDVFEGVLPSRLAATLSMPEQQIVEIAKAIGARREGRHHGRADRVA